MWLRNKNGVRKSECSGCGEPLDENRKNKYRYCRLCHNKYMRENRPAYSALSDEEKKRSNARAYMRVYVRRGHIKKLPCSVCGNKKSQGHHDDYSKPLEVKWLCRKHHNELHNNLNNSNNVKRNLPKSSSA